MLLVQWRCSRRPHKKKLPLAQTARLEISLILYKMTAELVRTLCIPGQGVLPSPVCPRNRLLVCLIPLPESSSPSLLMQYRWPQLPKKGSLHAAKNALAQGPQASHHQRIISFFPFISRLYQTPSKV
jgi:hypothetical protein